jgi:hypothetical protein
MSKKVTLRAIFSCRQSLLELFQCIYKNYSIITIYKETLAPALLEHLIVYIIALS